MYELYKKSGEKAVHASTQPGSQGKASRSDHTAATKTPLWVQASMGDRVPAHLLPPHRTFIQRKENTSSLPTETHAGKPVPNTTGLPDRVKAGIEDLSGMALDSVRVHYHSAKPAQVGALAYTQGTDIYMASGQEQHVAHEAWHVVQQAQGRVHATVQMKDGTVVSAESALEREADVMGEQAEHQTLLNGNSDPTDGASYVRAAHLSRFTPLSVQRRPIQCFFAPDIVHKYDGAATAWNVAAAQIRRFDGEIDAKIPGTWAAHNPTLAQLETNVDLKATRALGTMAGEAYETRSWQVINQLHGGAPLIHGPGGAAGIDIRTYAPSMGVFNAAVSPRIRIEVKTAQTLNSLKDALHNGGNTITGDVIHLYYHGNPNDVHFLAPFTRGGRNYTARGTAAFHNDPNSATVHAYTANGAAIRNFALTW